MTDGNRARFPRPRRRRRQGTSLETLASVLSRAGENRLSPVTLPVPPDVWRAAVGDRVAERAQPEKLENGTLIVRCATSAWANELSMLASDILPRLHARGVEVRFLRFRVRALDAPAPLPERRESRKLPPLQPLPQELEALVATVEDEGLRAAIIHAARAQLAWKAHVAPTKVVTPPTPARTPTSAPNARPSAGPPAARGLPTAGTRSVPRAQKK